MTEPYLPVRSTLVGIAPYSTTKKMECSAKCPELRIAHITPQEHSDVAHSQSLHLHPSNGMSKSPTASRAGHGCHTGRHLRCLGSLAWVSRRRRRPRGPGACGGRHHQHDSPSGAPARCRARTSRDCRPQTAPGDPPASVLAPLQQCPACARQVLWLAQHNLQAQP